MSTNLVIASVTISQKPGASKSNGLITTWSTCRVFGEQIDSVHVGTTKALR